MGKKSRSRNATSAGGTTAASATTASPKQAFLTVTSKSSVTDVLWHALASLDNIAEESHRHAQKLLQQTSEAAESRKRARDDGDGTTPPGGAPSSSSLSVAAVAAVYGAVARPHYETIATATAAYGLQLLPVLHEVTRRVGLALGTPALSSPESWETAAMLCSYYGAGPAARMAEELLEVLVRERGVFFFDAACVLASDDGTAAQTLLPKRDLAEALAGSGVKTKEVAGTWVAVDPEDESRDGGVESTAQQLLRHAIRKLNALREMLVSVGPYVPSSLLQRAALRFTSEVVEGGILSLEALSSTTSSALSSEGGDRRLCWRVPVACQAPALLFLQTLLTLRGAPAEVAVCATRVVAEVTASLHQGCPVRPVAPPATPEKESRSEAEGRGAKNPKSEKDSVAAVSEDPACYTAWPSFSLYKDVVAATVQLRHTLSLLRHPSAFPLYTPPTYAEERVPRKLMISTEPQPQQQPQQQQWAPIAVATVEPANASVSLAPQQHGEHPALAAPPPRSAAPSHVPPPAAVAPAPKSAERMVTAQPYVKETLTTAPPVRPTTTTTATTASGSIGTEAADEEESIPDIDMDDD